MRVNHQRAGTIAVVVLALLASACPFGTGKGQVDTREVKSKLDSAANYLNAAAKSNRELNRQNVINDTDRRVVAGRINTANGWLKKAVERARSMRPGEIELAKKDVIALLNKALDEIQNFRIGNAKIDDTIALVAPLLRQAIALVQLIKETT